MRKWTIALCLAGLLAATQGQVQAGHGLFKHRAVYGASIPGNTAGYGSFGGTASSCPTCAASGGTTGYAGTGYGATGSVTGSSDFGATSPPVRPYSYYAAQPPGAARGYYGYGEDQFPLLWSPLWPPVRPLDLALHVRRLSEQPEPLF